MVTSPKKATFSWQRLDVALSERVASPAVGVGKDGSRVPVGLLIDSSSDVGVGLVSSAVVLALVANVGEAVTSSGGWVVGVASPVTVEVTST